MLRISHDHDTMRAVGPDTNKNMHAAYATYGMAYGIHLDDAKRMHLKTKDEKQAYRDPNTGLPSRHLATDSKINLCPISPTVS